MIFPKFLYKCVKHNKGMICSKVEFKSPPFNKEKNSLKLPNTNYAYLTHQERAEAGSYHPFLLHGVWVVSKLLMNEINGVTWKRGVFISFSSERLPMIRAQISWEPAYFSPFRLILLPPVSSLVCLHLFCLLSPLHLSHSFPPTLSQPFPSRFLSGWHASVWSWNALFLGFKMTEKSSISRAAVLTVWYMDQWWHTRSFSGVHK